jgi:protein QN1
VQVEDAAHLEQQLADARQGHEREKKDLEARLQWYSENQEIVNKNDELLRAQDAKIKDLEREMQKLRAANEELEVSSRVKIGMKTMRKWLLTLTQPTVQGRLDLSGAHGETKLVRSLKKKIADLERQKKELQSEPHEIRELIRAAQPSAEESKEVEALRTRVTALEKDAEDIADDAERRMRALRQEVRVRGSSVSTYSVCAC